MSKNRTYTPKDGPYSQANRELLNVLYKYLLHPSWWDDRPLLEFSPKSLEPGVLIKADHRFNYVAPKLRQFYMSIGYEVRTENQHTISVREAVSA